LSQTEFNIGELKTDKSLAVLRRELAASRIAGNLQLLDGVAPDIPIDHAALDQRVREIAEMVMEADSKT